MSQIIPIAPNFQPVLFQKATVDFYQLYNQFPDIFSGFNVPDGLVKQDCIDNIIFLYGKLEPCYTEPDLLEKMISVWSTKNQTVWKELYDTTQYNYDPIYNYDRNEEYVDIRARTNKAKETRDGTTKTTGTDDTTNSTNTKTTYNDNNTQQTESTGYNSNALQLNGKTTYNGDGDATVNGTDTGTRNTESTQTEKDTRDIDATDGEQVAHKARMYGNIGVTTTQQMIDAQRQTVLFNLYDVIARDFAKHFLLAIR